MGLLDFLNKGDEKPVNEPKKAEVKPAPAPAATKTTEAPATASAPVTSTDQTYTVKSGDSLSKIAKHFYGDANKWNIIFQVNKKIITNPDLIKPGQILKIPKE